MEVLFEVAVEPEPTDDVGVDVVVRCNVEDVLAELVVVGVARLGHSVKMTLARATNEHFT